jgi:multidrug efflux pump subunit AcrA (membrane-fusion protein)
VEVTIDNPKKLKPGMVVTILVGQHEEMVLVPMTAVQRGESTDEFCVFGMTEKNGKTFVHKRRVQLDGVFDNRIRLVESKGSEVGIGDKIVVTGAFRLTNGQEVRVLDIPEPVLKIGE